MSIETEIIIRRATHDDARSIGLLIPESVRALGARYYTSEQIESALINVFGVDTQLIEDGSYYVASAGGRVVGCGGWSRRRTMFGGDQMKTGEDTALDPREEPARIRAFYVHPDWARRGIGGRLIEACEEAARNAGFLAVELVATLPGEPLYAAFGYEVVERFDQALPGGLSLPLTRMRKVIAD